MNRTSLQIRKISYTGPQGESEVRFSSGINVVCGASDTGKSFLSESIDYMLGGSILREIPERDGYDSVSLTLVTSDASEWIIRRSSSGGNLQLESSDNDESKILKEKHAHDRIDNLSGFLLDSIGLLGKFILRSKGSGKTQSLSFRNLARLIIVQEDEIQQKGSPFWGGQFTLKTAELATIKLLLTGIDDSSIITPKEVETSGKHQAEILTELIAEIEVDIAKEGADETELREQLSKLNDSIDTQKKSVDDSQGELDKLIVSRRELHQECQENEHRIEEINELLARFGLLEKHYQVDLHRLESIEESGNIFAHLEEHSCPLCGANSEQHHLDDNCDGNIDVITNAASAEISKIIRLKGELTNTIEDLKSQKNEIAVDLEEGTRELGLVDIDIKQKASPKFSELRADFTSFVEKRADVQKVLSLFERLSKLETRKKDLLDEEVDSVNPEIIIGIPDSIAHQFSLKISKILKAWNFPGDCLVHFDKKTSDFVIDGKPRGSRGKGLRAITYAAVTIGMLEFCQERDLAHPGFIVLDSPLLAYYKPEEDEEAFLAGSNLDEKFYDYLVKFHKEDSQIIIIENKHPPASTDQEINLEVFTGNPDKGRQGFL